MLHNASCSPRLEPRLVGGQWRKWRWRQGPRVETAKMVEDGRLDKYEDVTENGARAESDGRGGAGSGGVPGAGTVTWPL